MRLSHYISSFFEYIFNQHSSNINLFYQYKHHVISGLYFIASSKRELENKNFEIMIKKAQKNLCATIFEVKIGGYAAIVATN